MKIEQKVEELCRFCDGTLTIPHFAQWEVLSYGKGTFFEGRPDDKRIRADTFPDAISLAYAEMQKEDS